MNKLYLVFIFIGVSFSVPRAKAEVSLGVGYSSFTSAQNIPSLLLAYSQPSWSIDFTSTGFASKYDYFSGYSSSYYWTYKPGTLFGGDVDAGFGAGLYFTQRGFRESLTTSTSNKNDIGFGPSFNVIWSPAQWFFVRVQSLFAISHANNMMLFFQDSSNASVGFQW